MIETEESNYFLIRRALFIKLITLWWLCLNGSNFAHNWVCWTSDSAFKYVRAINSRAGPNYILSAKVLAHYHCLVTNGATTVFLKL